MRTFQEFVAEAYDASVMSSSQIRRTGEGGRIGAERRKTAPERRRVKAIGGGQTAPAKPYKPRKDIGQQRAASTRVQQPEQERGSAREKQLAAAKEERRKAAQARIAAKKAGAAAPAADKPKAKEATKTATQLLAKKKKETVSPDYKPAKASGLSRQERLKVTRQGEAKLRDLVIAAEKAKGKKVSGEKDLKHRYTSR
jgi:hypothetical protein